MFWKRRGQEEHSDPPEEGELNGDRFEPIEIERDAPRPPTILRVADRLEERGGEILELFKEVRSPRGQAVFPIHVRQDGREFFVEVETGPWGPEMVEQALNTACVLRASEHADADLEIMSAYPVPREVDFLSGRSPAALLQLDLLEGSLQSPEDFAETFRVVAGRHWGVDLHYDTDSLLLSEELLIALLNTDATDHSGELSGEPVERPLVIDALVEGLGCYLGEVIRRNTRASNSWQPAGSWGEGAVLEFEQFKADPIGKARAFLYEGPEDSIAFYARYVLDQLSEAGESQETDS